jgi:hypothetical protein
VADPPQPGIPGRLRSTNALRDGDLSPSPGAPPDQLTHRVFVSDEALLDVSFTAAQARLTRLLRGGVLGSASAHAYSDGITGLAWLAHVHFQDLAVRGDSARLALRWEAAEPGGGSFPALDADITLAPAGEHFTTLRLAGVYRLPPGAGAGLDQTVMARVSAVTIRAFLHHITQAILHPAGAAGPGAAADPDPAWPPTGPETP